MVLLIFFLSALSAWYSQVLSVPSGCLLYKFCRSLIWVKHYFFNTRIYFSFLSFWYLRSWGLHIITQFVKMWIITKEWQNTTIFWISYLHIWLWVFVESDCVCVGLDCFMLEFAGFGILIIGSSSAVVSPKWVQVY